jgi:tyrosyl-DNA phosphodiesterase-1
VPKYYNFQELGLVPCINVKIMPIQRSLKRRRLDDGTNTFAGNSSNPPASPFISLQRDVSPPVKLVAAADAKILVEQLVSDMEDEDDIVKGKTSAINDDIIDDESADETHILDSSRLPEQGAVISMPVAEDRDVQQETGPASKQPMSQTKLYPSPLQLTRIRDLPPSHNVNAVLLHNLLGNPLIKECWQFNYLLSIPFILQHFDTDVRSLVALKIVHGFWKNDDTRKQKLQEQAEAAIRSGAKVQLIAAHMPEMYGTHHTKMMILIRHDGVAQVVIHTANMIEQDWTNLTQAVWRSPELPLIPDGEQQQPDNTQHAIGTGLRFKADLLKYLNAYSNRTRGLVDELKKYDFSSVRAALIASTPSKIPLDTSTGQVTTPWGWPGLKHILSQIPVKSTPSQSVPVINIQISSIATLTEKWIQSFLAVLESHAKPAKANLGTTKKPQCNIIFPTAGEIRRSLDGYASGASIHMKLKSPAQQKQLQLLKPMLCHWDSTFGEQSSSTNQENRRQAMRNRAAPHIKTYIRFKDTTCKEIDWAIVTSANLSQQAWGFPTDKYGEVRIASYEIGAVVWPDLFNEGDEGNVVMVPTFASDMPAKDAQSENEAVVGLRMPYDLPLTLYGKDDVPWCASTSHLEPDWAGKVWKGYENSI